MPYKKVIEEARSNFEKAFSFLEKELMKVRSGRINPALIEDLQVNMFGSSYPLKQLAAISSSQSNQIIIQPWDSSYIEPIEKAISQSNLGFSIVVEKNLIRLTTPPLTEDYKQQLIKMLNEKAEQVRQTIRRYRDTAWNRIQDLFKEKEITEDEKFRGKEDLQKVVDEYNKKIKDLIERKKEELT